MAPTAADGPVYAHSEQSVFVVRYGGRRSSLVVGEDGQLLLDLELLDRTRPFPLAWAPPDEMRELFGSSSRDRQHPRQRNRGLRKRDRLGRVKTLDIQWRNDHEAHVSAHVVDHAPCNLLAAILATRTAGRPHVRRHELHAVEVFAMVSVVDVHRIAEFGRDRGWRVEVGELPARVDADEQVEILNAWVPAEASPTGAPATLRGYRVLHKKDGRAKRPLAGKPFKLELQAKIHGVKGASPHPHIVEFISATWLRRLIAGAGASIAGPKPGRWLGTEVNKRAVILGRVQRALLDLLTEEWQRVSALHVLRARSNSRTNALARLEALRLVERRGRGRRAEARLTRLGVGFFRHPVFRRQALIELDFVNAALSNRSRDAVELWTHENRTG